MDCEKVMIQGFEKFKAPPIFMVCTGPRPECYWDGVKRESGDPDICRESPEHSPML